MNPAQILGGAASVKPAGSAGAARAEPTAFAAAPGTAFEAEVVQVQAAQPGAASLTAAADGRLQTQVLLRLGNALVGATLPGAAPQPGARLSLIYLGSQNGQPQFLLAPQQAAQTSAQSQLSGPGQLLGLLQQMQATASASSANPGGAGADARAATAAATPVWTNPAQPLQQAAQQLASALQQSGLFYESHLGAWAQGQQPLSALLTQPQGRLSPLLQTAAQTAAQTTTLQTAAATADAAARGPGPGHGAQPGPAPTGAAAATLMTTPPAEAATAVRHAALAVYNAVQAGPQAASDPATLVARLPAELHGVVQQQLQTLMQGQIVWEGLLWPGQTARWSLRPDPEGHATQGPSAERAWSTQVELELPQLGPVQARLRLNGNRLDLWLRRSPQAQQRIDAALPQLRAALQSAGLEVGRVQLGQNGAGEPN